MPRFRQGTTDHDGDSRMGGSMKGDDEMAKSKTKAKAPEPAVMAAGASEENAREGKGAEPEAKDAKAESGESKAKKQLSADDRIDAIIEVLAANGMTLPKKLR